MHDMISTGKALYWGTSEWGGPEIKAAFDICDRYGLRKPVVEQPQYNLFWREKVEKEFSRLYDACGIGLTTWSPLASGILSGKYLKGIPSDSRLAQQSMSWLREELTPEKTKRVARFVELAANYDCTPSQLAIAWCLKNPNVSSVITGASRPEQVVENMKSFDVFKRLPGEAWKAIDQIFV
jgi:aryl-alcohol dehydrogenase-like predicted oxidoreductase